MTKIICHDLIQLDLPASSKTDALEQMASRLYQLGRISDCKSFLADIFQREELGSTYIGNHIAIPHGQSITVQQLSIVIARTTQPIKWDPSEDFLVQHIVLLVLPQQRDITDYLADLSAIVELLVDPLFVNEFTATRSSEAMLQLIQKHTGS